MKMKPKKHILWADKHNIGKVPARDAYCNKCCDTAALKVLGKWHCGSCGSTRLHFPEALE